MFRWFSRQARGTARNARAVGGKLRPKNVLPPAALSTGRWLKDQGGLALGRGTPTEQMTASVTLAIVMIISSLGALTPLAAVMILPFTIGALRLVPFVDSKIGGGDRSSSRGKRRRWSRRRRRD